ncbi:MAG: hypothetical protein EXR86_00255 [Gammaproteobacteria bacterium]|nr:hypothetical protein [Gammaproteobacteria bacterium]
MTKVKSRCGLLFALLAWSVLVAAQEWYQVEVIAFRYPVAAESSWAASEIPTFGGTQRLSASDGDVPTTTAMYTELRPHELQLAGAYKVLQGSSTYQTVFHRGWRQSAGDSRPVYLTETGTADPAASPTVEGAVRLAIGSNAMRVNSEFVVHLPESTVAVSESRAVSDGELHYFDHPLLGVLVQVTNHLDEAIENSGLPLEPRVEPPR